MRSPTAALMGLLSSALAIDLTLYLPTTPNPFTLSPTTHATLTSLGSRFSAPISSVNTFAFHNVSGPASYLVDVHCPSDGFMPLRVDVAADGSVEGAWHTFRGNEWDNKGESAVVVGAADGVKRVELRALGRKNYFTERPKFSVLSLFKNPMILMGLFSMVLFIGMPYLMDNLDPEMKAELEQRQKQGMGAGSGQAPNPLGNFDMAAYLAGSGSGSGGSKNQNQGVKR